MTQTTNSPDGTTVNPVEISPYTVVERGPNYKVWNRVTAVTNTLGEAVYHTNSYTELATGMHYTNASGQLLESQELIEPFAQGAIAAQGNYSVIFANNLNSAGSVDMQTTEGKHLPSSILGLAYYDHSTGSNLVFAQIQDSQGELVSTNQTLFTNAFTGASADVRYTYKIGGFEQDVILRNQPPTPESFGLNSQFTDIEVITEFINPPQPSIVEHPARANLLPDPDIRWGATQIGHGKAFELGGSPNKHLQVPVSRRYVTAEGRNFLIESVPMEKIQSYLSGLPTQASSGSRPPVIMASKTLALPKRPLAQAQAKPMKLASATPAGKGYVLDYVILNSDTNDFEFQTNQTYFISGGVNISGTTTFDGGAVIKFSDSLDGETYNYDPSSGTGCGALTCDAVVCQTDPYHQVVFTSMDDDSVGQTISGSSGSPATMSITFLNESPSAWWNSPPFTNVNFFYANVAVVWSYFQFPYFQNCQFLNCNIGFGGYGGVLTMNNCLLAGSTGIQCSEIGDSFVLMNVTMANSGNNLDLPDVDGNIPPGWAYGYSSIYITNGLFTGGQTLSSVEATLNSLGGTVQDTFNADAPTPNFQSYGTGNFFLPPNSPFIDAGSTTADQLGLYFYTTQTNQAIEGISTVDLGFHYPAVDTNGNPVSTLVSGYPDYHSDPSGVGLADSWQMTYFGNLNQFGSELDDNGNTLLYDCQHGINPTNSQFIRLGYWPFDNTNTWMSADGQSPLLATNITGVPSWSTNAVLIDSTNTAMLKYCEVKTNYNANVDLDNGTVSFWFKPDWNGTNAGGSGPGGLGRFIEMGDHTTNGGYWGFSVSADGTRLYFESATNGVTTSYFTNQVSWTSNAWHQLVLAYSTNATQLYVDGAPATNGPGLTGWPPLGSGSTNGFSLGNSRGGTNQARGQFEELQTFDYPFTSANASNAYHAVLTNRLAVILQNPSNLVLLIGQSAMFSVKASSPSSPSFQWQLNGTNIAGATSSTLTINNVQTTNAGNYVAVVSNPAGSTNSATAVLTVVPPTVTLVNPTNGATYALAPAIVPLQAVVTNGNGQITNMEFFQGTTLLAQTAGTNYQCSWTNAAAGLYSLTAVAQLTNGQSVTSASVNITVTSGCGEIYSSSNAFGSGVLYNLNYTNAYGNLQINTQLAQFPYLNVACGSDGTLVRIDTSTTNIVGEYKTAPDGKPTRPGHVVVDRLGNVWVANWSESGVLDGTGMGSVTRIGLVIGGTRGDVFKDTNGVVTNFVTNSISGQYLKPPFQYCTAIDRDGDGYIHTSFGLTNVLDWPSNNTGRVQDAVDECIINYTRVPSQLVSALALDANNDLWTGGYCVISTPDWGSSNNVCSTKIHVKVNGVTGRVITNSLVIFSNNATEYGGFEGLVAGSGLLFSSGGANPCGYFCGGDGNDNGGNYSLVVYDPVRGTNSITVGSAGNFGTAIDPHNGNVWITAYDGSSNVYVYSPAGALLTNYNHGDSHAGGLAIDNNSNVWVSHGPWDGGNTVGHLRTDGTWVGNVTLGTTDCPASRPASAVSVDAAGKVWAICSAKDGTSPNIYRIDPNAGASNNGYHIGAADLCVPLPYHGSRESYGDMTGQQVLAATPASGFWSVIYDQGTSTTGSGLGTDWATVTWNASTNNTNQVRVEIRAANQQAWLNTNNYQLVQSGVPLTNLSAEYVQIRVTLTPVAGTTNSPWLHDLTFACTHPISPPVVQFTDPTNGQLFVLSPTNILLTASVTPGSGMVTNVTFLNGSTVLGQATTVPFQFLWTNVAAGSYTLSAVASASDGPKATNSVSFTVNAMPVVTITSPTNSQTFLELTNVTIAGTLSDSDGWVTNVTLYSGTNLIASTNLAATNAFSLVWSNRSAGPYPIMAVATDNRGAPSASAIKVFEVNPTNTPPSVWITYPGSNAVFAAGSDITLTASVTPGTGTVTNVEFFANGESLGSDPNAPYSLTVCCWEAGNYELQAVARDGLGNSSCSAPINIQIGSSVTANGTGFWDPSFQFLNRPFYVDGISCLLSSGSNLYVGGTFFQDSPSVAGNLAMWNGTYWDGLGAAYAVNEDIVMAIALDGTNLYVGGLGGSGGGNEIYRWLGGTDWEPPATNYLQKDGSFVSAIAVVGSDIYIGGNFISAGDDTNIAYIAKLDRATSMWRAVGTNVLNGPVYAITQMGGNLFIGGAFTNAGSASNANYVAEMRGDDWVSLGSGLSGIYPAASPAFVSISPGVFALAACGTNLFVGGNFTSAGGNTNANGIARWNGQDWAPIHSGLTADTNLTQVAQTNLEVDSISVRGNTIFVGGQFQSFQPDLDSSQAYQIARVTWNESLQDWVWSPLDAGVFGSVSEPSSPWGAVVYATAIMEGPTPDVYDLYVGGNFNEVGSSHNQASDLVRWSVGKTYPTNAAQVAITYPVSGSVFTNPATLTLQASATPGAASISSVQFFVDGNSVGSPSGSPPYSAVWSSPVRGGHLASAKVTDSVGLISASPAVPFEVVDTNNPVVANPDVFTVLANSPAVALPVLTNDTPTGTVKISNVDHWGSTLGFAVLGTATVSHDRTYLSYQPLPNYYGTDRIHYSITNSTGGADETTVTVHILAKPDVQINLPLDGTNVATNVNVIVSGSAHSPDSTVAVTNIALLVNGTNIYVQTNNPVFSFAWTTNAPAFYTFVAVATDNNGITNTSLPVTIAVTNNSTATNVLTASIDNLTNTPSIGGGFVYPIVRDGLFDLLGKANDSNVGDPVSYQILLYEPSAPNVAFANVTPVPRDAEGFHSGRASNDLGTVDFSGIPNGVYDLELVVRGGGAETNATVRFALDTQLKIGQFSFSEQDMVIPANGIPLTVVRTYNSLNPISSDFGYSWSYALNSMDVQLDEDRQDVTIGSATAPFADDEETDTGLPKVVSVRTGGGRDVTLTLPDGRRTTFVYKPLLEPDFGVAQWNPPPDVHATLISWPPGSEIINYYPTLAWQDGGAGSTYDTHDVPGWMLQTQDGTRYYITRGSANNITYDDTGNGHYVNVQAYGPPQLTSIVQPTLNTTAIGSSGITNFPPNSSTPTRTVYFDRDGQNRIIGIHDPISGSNGLPVVQYVYDQDNGNLLQVLKLQDRSAGTYTTNKYHYDNPNFPHYITSIENASGVIAARTLYDDQGRMIGLVDAVGKTNRFLVDLNARTQTVYDPLNNPTINFFDSMGNVTDTIDALGRHTSRTFDDGGNVTSVTDPLNHTYAYAYDGYGNQTCVIDPLNHTNLTAYNANGLPIAMTNALGFVTRYQYDQLGNQTNMLDAMNNSHGVLYNQNSSSTTFLNPFNQTNATATYDSMGNFASLTDESSRSTTVFAYDPNGNQTDSTNLWINPTNSSDVRVVAIHSVFDVQGREIASIDPNGLQSIVTYDPDGRQNQLVDAYNRTSGWVYDARGSLIQISFPDASISRMVYDDIGRLSVTDDKHKSGDIANGTRTTYDAVGQVVKSERLTNVVIDISTDGGISSSTVTSIGGVIAVSTFGYDLAGRQIAVTNGFGNVTRYEYDAAGNKTAVTDALSNRTDNVYDPTGHLIFTTNALHQITQYAYDSLGRFTRTIYPDGTFTAVAYDAVGNRLAETNQLGLVTTFLYDSACRITNIVRPGIFDAESNDVINPCWAFEYDANGQLASVSDPKRRATRFTYDQLGRTVTHTLPMGQMGSRAYDSFGRAFRNVDFKGQTNELIYDGIGRLGTNNFYAAGSSVANLASSYAYDSEDRPKQIVEPRGTNTFTYDNQGHVMQIATPEGTVNCEYEPIEGRRTRTYTAKSDVRYAYDELGRIKTTTLIKRDGVTLTTPEVTTNTYTALGSLQDVYYPNGIHAVYQYDLLMNRLTNLTYTSSSSVLLARYQYASATNGQWKSATEIQQQVNGTYVTNQLNWFYDFLRRLTNEMCNSTAVALNYTNQYVYNLVGNRLWATNVAGGITTVMSFTYNNNDQLLQEVTTTNGGSNGTFTNSYDANGALTNHSSGSEKNSYGYNLQNRLVSAIINRLDGGHQLSETINFTYDYQGNRVRAQWTRSVDNGANVNGTNIFLFQPNGPRGLPQVLEEAPAIGATPTASYTLGGRIISQSKGGVISDLLPDGHGSTRQLAGASGNITARYTYDAYGKGLDFTNGTQNPTATSFLYSGGQLDPDLQLYNLNARYLSANVGRFNQIDPFSPNQLNGANLYVYGADDPVNNSDPSGMYEIDVHQFLTQYLAEKAGFGNDAIKVGDKTQSLDAPGDPRDAMAGGGANTENMRAFHFVSQARLQELWHNAYFDGMPNGRFFESLGEYLHALEDTYAHCTSVGDRNWDYHGNITVYGYTVLDNGGFMGHGHLGHEPDHTWRDAAKAMKMAEEVYSDLVLFNIHYTANTTMNFPDYPEWSSIAPDLEKFMLMQPNVYDQAVKVYGRTFFVENATYDGYNQKIHLLNPNYNIDASVYANPVSPVFAQVKGRSPSKTIAGATRGKSLVTGGLNVVLTPSIEIK